MAAAIAIELKDILGIMSKSDGKQQQREYLTDQGHEKIHYRRIHSFSQHF
jgi:hypothetical protein